ncbi:MAG: dephospho-CoA kinase, partial [Oscillospiraceae bacterium]|nr:dephospho-CoA kinase [Oscillospiraceae bacterium]
EKEKGRKLAVVDAINLTDSGLAELCDVTVGVLADEHTRMTRIMARDGIDAERAQRRIRAQRSDEYYRRHCKIILENNGTEEAFLAAAAEALRDYLQ